MKPLAIIWVLLVGVVSAALSFVGFFAHMRTGGTPMIVTPGPAVVFALKPPPWCPTRLAPASAPSSASCG